HVAEPAGGGAGVEAEQSGGVEPQRVEGAGELVCGAGGELDPVGHVDDREAGAGRDRGGGLGDRAAVRAGAPLLDDAPGVAAGPGEAGGEQRDVETVPAHRVAEGGVSTCSSAPSASRNRPVQAVSALWLVSRASTARSTRGSSASPCTVMSPSLHAALTAPQRARSPVTTGSGNGAAISARSGRMNVGRLTGSARSAASIPSTPVRTSSESIPARTAPSMSVSSRSPMISG